MLRIEERFFVFGSVSESADTDRRKEEEKKEKKTRTSPT